MQINREMADFNISGPSMKLTEAKIKRHVMDNVQYEGDANICGRSMNSEAFSHFSLPSNNLVNGLKIMPHMNYNPINENESEFSSVIASGRNMTTKHKNVPLQMCQSSYEGDMMA